MTVDPAGLTLRPLSADELPALVQFTESVFLSDVHDEGLDLDRRVFEPERSLAFFDSDQPVASTAIYSRELTVPGGLLPVAAVTAVAVAPTHRRRGLLSAMMRAQIDDLHERRQESVAILWASEAAIYGRYGYGLAASANHLSIASRETRLRPDVARSGSLQLCSSPEARPAMSEVYEQVRPGRVGYLDRRGAWWDARTFDPSWRREGASALRFAVHRDDQQRPDSYAIFATKPTWDTTGPRGEIVVREVQAATPAGYAAIWDFLLEMDLVRKIRWDRAALDEPLVFLVDNPRAVGQCAVDSLWVRIVDVDRALAGRTYAMPLDTVLEVTDLFCPWNSGRFRLTGDAAGARCVPTTDDADLTLTAAALGAAFLGGASLATLAAAGLVVEERPGALATATAAFVSARPPACPEIF